MPVKIINNSEFRNSTLVFYAFRISCRSRILRMLRPLRGLKNCLGIDSRGFTLIELLVVMAVIGILSTIILANYNNFAARQAVKNAAAELKSNLRKYQTYALAGQKNPDPSQPNCYDAADPAAHILSDYAVVIDSGRYRAILTCFAPAGTVELPWVDLPDGLSINSTCSPIAAKFLPSSEGVVLPCGGGGVQINISNGSDTSSVIVTSSGEIK